VDMARHAGRVVVIEDGIRVGGIGSSIAATLSDASVVTPYRVFGIPREFIDQGKRAQILEAIGLTSQQISRDIVEWVASAPATTTEPTDASSVTAEGTQPPVAGTAGQ